ncbi:MAG: Mut7-C RNAse domain-containing protein [candidate division KSB1 bacterium]|nr:Mut7-C RNAse domain-containing protein [candidate division KSB1 bacterium]
MKTKHTAWFRFYEELNDFLPRDKKKRDILYEFSGHPGVKDAIEALGVPHPEVELILVNGKSVGFDYHLQHGDRVSVYPMFESLDVRSLIRLRPQPLRIPRFVLDVHLGKLAANLRLLGFDALYRNDYSDPQIIDISVNERRIILTRDRGILKTGAVTHGYCLRSDDPEQQTREVLSRFDLYNSVSLFTRCVKCNGKIVQVEKHAIQDQIPEKAAKYYDDFHQCQSCGQIYWKGSHFSKMQKKIKKLLKREN